MKMRMGWTAFSQANSDTVNMSIIAKWGGAVLSFKMYYQVWVKKNALLVYTYKMKNILIIIFTPQINNHKQHNNLIWEIYFNLN